MSKILKCLPSLVLGLVLTLLAGSAHAQRYEIRNVRAEQQAVRGPVTAVEGYSSSLPGGILTLAQELGVSNTYSAGVGVSAQVISASVGFDVTYFRKFSYQYQTRPIPRGKYVRIDAYNLYQPYSFEIWMTPAFSSRTERVGSGIAMKFMGARYVETVR